MLGGSARRRRRYPPRHPAFGPCPGIRGAGLVGKSGARALLDVHRDAPPDIHCAARPGIYCGAPPHNYLEAPPHNYLEAPPHNYLEAPPRARISNTTR
ncbi:hypothetical protein UA74_19380 [Actinoalloteichus fjordicus]|uniref:Uncharacterized protein n=1 Tax=Actinoalloteichus fjordicus TaxID=1612552 RepID=A0AAC9LDZ6_9PSEU|nr:hypothetical protein UA74_19380 [Actinoalloteichus fjordicus]